MHSSILKMIALAGIALLGASPTWADTAGRHPAYLHALSDLRDARAHLEHASNDPIDLEQMHAIEQIDKAIGEIKTAAIMDGKNIQDHVPVDAKMDRPGRLHRARELLDKAHHDVSGEEDQPDTQGLQMRVIKHINAARNSVQHAIDIVNSHS